MAGNAKTAFVFVVAVIGLVTAYFVWLSPEGTDPLPPLVKADVDSTATGVGDASTAAASTEEPGEIRTPSIAGFGPIPSRPAENFLSDAAAQLNSAADEISSLDESSTPENSGRQTAPDNDPNTWDTPTIKRADGRNAVAIDDGGKDMPVLSDQEGLTDSADTEQPSNADDAEPVEIEDEAGAEDSTAMPRANQPESVESWTIADGDTLYVIAEKWFGDSTKWELIKAINPGLDPSRLQIGQVIRLPAKSATAADMNLDASTGEIHTVRSGETLSSIAQKTYGRATLWRVIYDANRDVIKGEPNELQVGMKLKIPKRPAEE